MAMTSLVAVGLAVAKSAAFKELVTYEMRQFLSKEAKEKYPEHIPIILERAENCDNVPMIEQKRFLCHGDQDIRQFLNEVRNRHIHIDRNMALFLFVSKANQNTVVGGQETFGCLYKSYKEDDGMLYLKYAGENTFG